MQSAYRSTNIYCITLIMFVFLLQLWTVELRPLSSLPLSIWTNWWWRWRRLSNVCVW